MQLISVSKPRHQKLERAEGMTSYKLSKLVAQLPLSGTDKAVLRAYADRYPNIWASIETTAYDTGFSDKTVRRCSQNLEANNLIKALTEKKGGRGRTVQYAINLDEVQRRLETLPERVSIENTPPQGGLNTPPQGVSSEKHSPTVPKHSPTGRGTYKEPKKCINREVLTDNPWLLGQTAQLLSQSFGQIVTLRPEDKHTILTLSDEYGALKFLTGLWRFVNTKQWYGISNPAGACTVFCREIETAINLKPRSSLRNFVEAYEDVIGPYIAGYSTTMEDAARLIEAATREDEDESINVEALAEYMRETYEGYSEPAISGQQPDALPIDQIPEVASAVGQLV